MLKLLAVLALLLDQTNGSEDPANTKHEGRQPEPDKRGSIGILRACLSTLYLCVWAVQRPGVDINLMSHQYPKRPTRWLSFFVFIVTLLTPEYVCYEVFSEFLSYGKAEIG